MVIEFCKCKKGKYRWRDVANVNGKIIKVDEEAELDQNKETFDIDPIIENAKDLVIGEMVKVKISQGFTYEAVGELAENE